MERFRSLNWNPSLEDILDNVFIRDERMERESALYRIMSDSFTNPFENMESEYADANIELIKKYLDEDGQVSIDTDEDQQEGEREGNSGVKKKEKSYVPGIRKLPFYFPRRSNLDKNQQAMCLRVLLKLSSNKKKTMNENEKRELQEYLALQEIISEEQKEYLKFAKSKWNDTLNWLIKCKKFVMIKWKAKMKRFEKLPRFYVEFTNIPLSVQMINFKTKDIKVTFVSSLREGTLSYVVLPKLNQSPVMLLTNPLALLERYPSCVTPDKVTEHFTLPVSEDTYCESLAREANADFVISSSGLKCLLSNIDPDYSNTWIIPVVVKSHDGKNIVFVDKRLPPTFATIAQKNTYVYKYILRYYFVDVKNESSGKTECTKNESEKTTNHSDSDSNNSSFNEYLKIYEDLSLSDTDKPEKSDKGQNVSYNLFTIGPIESPQHERIIHGVKEYQMLVRTKTDGIEMLLNKESESLILAPKMEHQLGFGAEAVTLNEGLQQWASLKFRPKTSLARVRIAADTAEVIQIEKHTTTSLSNEMKRLYNVKVDDSLSVLHNIIERLSSLTPGQYIMQHVPQNGPFAYVYKQDEHRTNVFDLHAFCQSTTFHTVPKTPWPLIDNMMTTPSIRNLQKMPAMFNPKIISAVCKGRPRGRPKKKNAAVTNNQVPVSLRRSVRLKKDE